MEAKKTALATPSRTRRVAYSLAASAAGAAVSADGQVVFVDFVDSIGEPVGVIDQGNYLGFNIDPDSFVDFYAENFIFGGGNYQGFYVQYFPGNTVGFVQGGVQYTSALSPGDLIDDVTTTSAVTFDTSLAYPNNPNAEFADVENAFIGLGFPIDGVVHFGWVRVTIDNAAGEFEVIDAAYNLAPGEGLVAGQISTAGDYNLDGKVDAADYTAVRDATVLAPIDLNFDGDFSGFVDAADVAIWAGNFAGDDTVTFLPGFTPAPAVSTPEPGTLGLLAAGAGGLLALRRWREPVSPLSTTEARK